MSGCGGWISVRAATAAASRDARSNAAPPRHRPPRYSANDIFTSLVLVPKFSCPGGRAPLLRHPKLCATGESAFSGPSRSVRGCGAPRPFPMAALPATNHTPAGTLGGTRPPAFEARSTSGGSDMRLLIHDIARSVGERRCQVKSVRACLLAGDDAGILSALSRLLEPSCEIVGKIADGK